MSSFFSGYCQERLGVKRVRWFLRTSRLRKNPQTAQKLTAGAEARTHSQGLTARLKVVPSQDVRTRVFCTTVRVRGSNSSLNISNVSADGILESLRLTRLYPHVQFRYPRVSSAGRIRRVLRLDSFAVRTEPHVESRRRTARRHSRVGFVRLGVY